MSGTEHMRSDVRRGQQWLVTWPPCDSSIMQPHTTSTIIDIFPISRLQESFCKLIASPLPYSSRFGQSWWTHNRSWASHRLPSCHAPFCLFDFMPAKRSNVIITEGPVSNIQMTVCSETAFCPPQNVTSNTVAWRMTVPDLLILTNYKDISQS